MHIRIILASLATMVMALWFPAGAQGAAQVIVWPGQFSYETPSGTIAWNSTAIGLRLDQSIGPFVAVGTTLFYGPAFNLSFAGTNLSGYSGQTFSGDLSLRLGVSAGPIGAAAYAGYGGFVLNATGPAAPDRIVLSSLGFRVGGETKVPLAQGLDLRGSWTVVTGLNSRADMSLSAPPTAASFTGTGSGNEYQVAVSFSPVPLTSISIGYRAGTYQTAWSGGGTSVQRFSGVFAGFEIRF